MSARDVLHSTIAHASHNATPADRERILDALLAHPVELLALLAEPKVCETCGGKGTVSLPSPTRWADGVQITDTIAMFGKCPDCHATSSAVES